MKTEEREIDRIHRLEAKWQARWEKQKWFACPDFPPADRPPYYLLVMFPYPSGRLHMGHVRNYTIGDLLARYHRARGRTVLHPIGWDAFGLPAENAAIEHGVHPEKWTRDNIANMKSQMKRLGFSYDWDREIATCDPEYYRWNQWFFLKFLERGLAYRKNAPVNFCPSCRTVLANEQVHPDEEGVGRCWRCDSEVETREREQWFFRITAYARELLDGHRLLEKGWAERILKMQQHWIGESEGAEVDFRLENSGRILTVFTTRVDTLFGCTYLALAPQHPWAAEIASTKQRAEVARFLEKARKSAGRRAGENRPKEGVFTGSWAVNPANGRRVPIWIADYVLMEYGSGAIMAVPAHDDRDFEFAKKYGLEITEVIRPPEGSPAGGAYTGEGTLVNSGEFNGTSSVEAREKIAEWLARRGAGRKTTQYRLRDWLISRQRYWGTPIPILYCETCGTVPVPEKDLPVLLPKEAPLTGTGESPLAQVPEFVNAKCPRCGGAAKRETDTMDTFVDSSWYYARYLDPRSGAPFAKEKVRPWLPVAQYVGGAEHACMHLLYARFFHRAMRDLGLVEGDEPFARLLNQGMVILGGAKMSKSRGNIVDPDEMVERYGADSVRLFILFAAPPQKDLEWSEEGVAGCWRFLRRLERAVAQRPGSPVNADADADRKLRRATHEAIRRVTRDMEEEFQFNTAIAAAMELLNELERTTSAGAAARREAVETLLRLLHPFAPHLTEELWERIGRKTPLANTPWPVHDPEALKVETVSIAVQINGKLRGRLEMPAEITAEKVLEAIRSDRRFQPWIRGSVQRHHWVPGRLINLVVR